MTHGTTRALRWTNGIAFALTIGVNLLAGLLPLGGVQTGDISKRYENLFTPAPFTFGIWGVIYLLLTGFVLYQAGAFKKADEREKLVSRIGGWFAASSVLNILWLVTWHYNMILLSTLMIFGLLVALIVLVKRVRNERPGTFGFAFGQAPFSLYFGWVTVAAVANVCVLLVKGGFSGFGLSNELWTIIVLLLGALILGAVITREKDWVYGLAAVWAYIGILSRHLMASGYAGRYPAIIGLTAVLLAALAVLTVRAFLRWRAAP